MELPDRCDRSWFVQTFMGGPSEQNENANEEDDVWPFIKAFNMYDPLCCIAALEENEKFFRFHKVTIEGAEHR